MQERDRPSPLVDAGLEFAAIDLGDSRRNKRARKMAEAMARNPGESLPRTFDDEAHLEATYRFLGNTAVSFEKVVAPHMARTLDRATAVNADLLVVHDTTEMKFAGEFERPGLG